MKICQDHWKMMRDAVDECGMTGLIAKSSEAAMSDQVRQLEEAQAAGSVSEQTIRDTFDPLMSMHWHWTNAALRNGGLYLMGADENGNEYCQVCEHVKNINNFDAKKQIDSVAGQMRIYCIEQKLIPDLS